VVIFDRIREYLHIHPKRTIEVNMNDAINSTLRRTFSTSFSVLIVLLAIFLFGGTSMRGFIMALLVGVVSGTYSTVFIATPIVYDAQRWSERRKAKKAALATAN
jgi:SecD/SecF fusion protein